MQLAAISLIGEYIARIYVQTQQRPVFMVAEHMGHAGKRLPESS